MKKNILSLFVMAACGASSSTALYAGSMGPVESTPSVRPFISGEGLYSWPSRINGLTTSTFTSSVPSTGLPQVTNRGWGGRLAAGLITAMSDRFAYSGEMGWGYYGHTVLGINYTPPLSAADLAAGIGHEQGSMDRWGFDVLAGVLYTQPKYDLYFKAGALFQNTRFNLSGVTLSGSGVLGTVGGTLPEVLPEIKLGAAYHVTNNLAATVSWMYAFGGKFGFDTAYSNTTSPAHVSALAASLSNTSMNVAMFGLEYRFG